MSASKSPKSPDKSNPKQTKNRGTNKNKNGDAAILPSKQEVEGEPTRYADKTSAPRDRTDQNPKPMQPQQVTPNVVREDANPEHPHYRGKPSTDENHKKNQRRTQNEESQPRSKTDLGGK